MANEAAPIEMHLAAIEGIPNGADAKSWVAASLKDQNDGSRKGRPRKENGDNEARPNFAGDYSGAGNVTDFNCINPLDNGTRGHVAVLAITQAGNAFHGTLTIQGDELGESTSAVDGTALPDNQAVGTYTGPRPQGDQPGTSSGFFQLTAVQNTLVVHYTGTAFLNANSQVFCHVYGSFLVEKSAAPE
jgi:hypothetical protein